MPDETSTRLSLEVALEIIKGLFDGGHRMLRGNSLNQ